MSNSFKPAFSLQEPAASHRTGPARVTAPAAPGGAGHGLLDRGHVGLELEAVDGGEHVGQERRGGRVVVLGLQHEERALPAVAVVWPLVPRWQLLQRRRVVSAVADGGMEGSDLLRSGVDVHCAAGRACSRAPRYIKGNNSCPVRINEASYTELLSSSQTEAGTYPSREQCRIAHIDIP
jgi:hypothetical protein